MPFCSVSNSPFQTYSSKQYWITYSILLWASDMNYKSLMIAWHDTNQMPSVARHRWRLLLHAVAVVVGALGVSCISTTRGAVELLYGAVAAPLLPVGPALRLLCVNRMVAPVRCVGHVVIAMSSVLWAFLHAALAQLFGQPQRGGASGGGDGWPGRPLLLKCEHVLLDHRAAPAAAGGDGILLAAVWRTGRWGAQGGVHGNVGLGVGGHTLRRRRVWWWWW